jgi:hypothetical protein
MMRIVDLFGQVKRTKYLQIIATLQALPIQRSAGRVLKSTNFFRCPLTHG